MDLYYEDGLVTAKDARSGACPENPPIARARAAVTKSAPIAKGQRRFQKQRSNKCHLIGCKHNLVKAYDKKARTCSYHRKEPQVDFEGVLHRFCQQCSRFHPLTDFDGDRKNCRQRLQQHNRRQRKMRMLRRPNGLDDSYDQSDSTQSQDTMVTDSEREKEDYSDGTCATAPAAAELHHELVRTTSTESPMPSEITDVADVDGLMLSSGELDLLLGPYLSSDYAGSVQQLLDISTAVNLAGNALAAEDVWHDQWFKPALGAPDEAITSPRVFGGDPPALGNLY